MELKTSSFSNDSLPDPNFASPLSDISLILRCYISPQSSVNFVGFYITNIIFLMPLCITVLYHVVQQWWQKRSTSATATLSHSDIFTLHVVMVDLIGVSGCIVSAGGIYSDDDIALFVSTLLWFFSWYGESMFHTVTCLERYLAVVHPIAYMNLRNEKGIRIRNVSIACAWLLSFMGLCSILMEIVFNILNCCVLVVTLLIVSFCSISVLFVLIRPGPGKQAGTRERVDQSKKRAFHTIVAIFATLMLRFLGGIIWMIVYTTEFENECLIFVSVIWLNLPSGLVLPLLFLHRAGKLVFCKNFCLNVQKRKNKKEIQSNP